MTVSIAKIKVNANRRAADAGKVKELAESIQEIGLLNPVTVTENNVLIAGAHRLEAFKLLGRTEIEANVTAVSGLKAKLAEIDENLIRNELHYTERGDLLKERKEIYEELHPETKREATLKQNRSAETAERTAKSFVDDTSKKAGVSSRVIHEELQIAKNLEPEVKEIIRMHDIPKTDAIKLARAEPEKQRAVADKIAAGEAKSVSEAERKIKLETVRENLENISAQGAKAVKGVYDVIVIDPPWKMEKIERDERPRQSGFDYPAMSEEGLTELQIPAADNCHIFIWATHKHLPVALRLLEKWGFKYVCTFVWHKNGGFQPFGLPQYNCEFCLYAHKGNPQFIDFKNFFTCFNADRTGHSEKPEIFYETLRRVTAGRRLDMFNRRKIQGFDGWGNEAC